MMKTILVIMIVQLAYSGALCGSKKKKQVVYGMAPVNIADQRVMGEKRVVSSTPLNEIDYTNVHPAAPSHAYQ